MVVAETGAAAGNILLVDRDARLRADLADFLSRSGFLVQSAADSLAAEAVLATAPVDVVVLGEPADGCDPLLFCRRVVEQAQARVIMVSDQREEHDRVLGLEFGADDYLGKPFSHRELLARLRAIRRRQFGARLAPAAPIYLFDGLALDVGRCELRALDGRASVLQAGVMELLQVFVENPRRVLSREELISAGGLSRQVDERAIDMRMSRLRKMLRALGERDLIRTVRGSGYLLDAEVTLRRGRGGPPA
jgi:two-component system OmpR family response regulator